MIHVRAAENETPPCTVLLRISWEKAVQEEYGAEKEEGRQERESCQGEGCQCEATARIICSKTRFGVTRTASRLGVQGRGTNIDAGSVNITYSTKQLMSSPLRVPPSGSHRCHFCACACGCGCSLQLNTCGCGAGAGGQKTFVRNNVVAVAVPKGS